MVVVMAGGRCVGCCCSGAVVKIIVVKMIVEGVRRGGVFHGAK